jgi:uncharacterized membrane protein
MTDNLHHPDAEEQASRALLALVQRIENDERIDTLATRLQTGSRAIISGPAGSILRGDFLGHALHPLLTDFPLGCWLSAGLLDLVGGRSSRKAAQHLVGLGLVFVAPTAAAGLADWSTTDDPRVRRVGFVHAAGNTVVALCYFQSWRSRRAGRHLTGRAWGFAGGMLAWGTGYLGGHLSLVLGVGQGTRGVEGNAEGSERDESRVDAVDEDLIDFEQAAQLLDVTPERVSTMIEEGLLVVSVSDSEGEPRLRAAEVRALRLVGG